MIINKKNKNRKNTLVGEHCDSILHYYHIIPLAANAKLTVNTTTYLIVKVVSLIVIENNNF